MYFRHLRNLSGILAALLLLTACGKPAVTESSVSSDEPISEPVSEYATTDVSDHRKVSMDFDNIQPAGYYWSREHCVPSIREGFLQYFTIERDGKWGLILADGTQILPCLSERPVSICSQREWLWDGENEDNWKEASKESVLLTDYPICGWHGGGSVVRFVDPKSEIKKPRALHSIEGGGWLDENLAQIFPGSYFATYFSEYVDEEDQIAYLAEGGFWNFTNQSGKVLFPEKQFSMVSEFNEDELAAVKKDGKWAYVRNNGMYVTDFIYEDCWFSIGSYDEHASYQVTTYPYFAYPFHRGFAPVKKDGKWGVIDSSGTPWIPYEYEGAAPHPLGVWLKKDGVWETRRLRYAQQ